MAVKRLISMAPKQFISILTLTAVALAQSRPASTAQDELAKLISDAEKLKARLGDVKGMEDRIALLEQELLEARMKNQGKPAAPAAQPSGQPAPVNAKVSGPNTPANAAPPEPVEVITIKKPMIEDEEPFDPAKLRVAEAADAADALVRAENAAATARAAAAAAATRAAEAVAAQARSRAAAAQPPPAAAAVQPPPAPIAAPLTPAAAPALDAALPNPAPPAVPGGQAAPVSPGTNAGFVWPKVKRRVLPVLTSYLRSSLREEVTLSLNVDVAANGDVTRVSPQERGSLLIDQLNIIAIEAVRRWQFEAGTQDGKAIASHTTVRFKFTK